ncbi:hypothetical protein BDZ89DRAFT_1126917 [Hymenopellis radicata]|nr:hypothetical protein BDZ89DRAFT_1126917 [Hymenopellis radicata]
MSLWSTALSTRWAEDVAAAGNDDDDESRLPAPVVQQHSNNRRSQTGTPLKTFWRRFRQRTTTRASPPDDHPPHPLLNFTTPGGTSTDRETEIDEIVVDRCWSKEYASSSHASVVDDAGSTTGDDFEERYNPTSTVEHRGFWASNRALATVRWVLWANVKKFFNSRFADPDLELEYQKEVWAEGKRLAELASVFLIVNWLMAVLSIPKPTVIADKIFYYGISPVFTLPIFIFCRYDFYMRYFVFYQTVVCISAWIWAFYQILFLYMCGYYGSDVHIFLCIGDADRGSFWSELTTASGLIGAAAFLIFSSVLVIPYRTSWYRNIINFLAFQGFLLYMHFQRDMARSSTSSQALKVQIDKTTKAQMNERKAADSKYRLTSYVFHDKSPVRVRVPLNTAILAVQNMDASGMVPRTMSLEFSALEGSLSQMSKVLNDILDFHRMDNGKFEVLMRPYPFHQVLRSMFLTLELATSARELEFETDLDPKIDDFARRARHKALGESEEAIDAIMKENSGSEYGMVSGDENRLRQIVTNLAGNACKFTPKGGKLKISTRLVLPDVGCDSSEDDTKVCSSGAKTPDDAEKSLHIGSLSARELEEHDRIISQQEDSEKIVVRIEVTDTGLGIAPQDMTDANIFSAFIQTEQGRTQGGKGTGLGLALVRRIVKLSGGRLGVRSKVGAGSTFWVELPLGVGSKVLHPVHDLPCNQPVPPAFINLYPLSSLKTIDDSNHSHKGSLSIDHSDNVSMRAISSNSARSASALHGLMNQGGSVELSLAKFEPHSPVPTRTLGDPSSGTDFPQHYQYVQYDGESPSPSSFVFRAPDIRDSPTITMRNRPTHIPLPSPHSFTLDDPQSSSASTVVVAPDGLSGSGSGALLNAALPSPPPVTSSALFNQCEVLVVDDDDMTRRLMTRMLQRLGCEVTTAANGEIAMNILLGTPKTRTPESEGSNPILEDLPGADAQQRNFLVVFLDNQMPVMSGLKVVTQLRQTGRKDFVVGVTGNALISDQKEYIEAGADHVLTKPVLERSLVFMLHEAEQRRKAAPA